jgi:S-adenosylmethionine:tRNA ribosyltransferase-isomerase
MRLAEFDYPLPAELIAQEPAPERDAARLLVAERGRPTRHASVRDLPGVLREGDLLVLNDTRVIAARVRGRRPSGGRLELLFVRPLAADTWEVLVRGGPRPGEAVHLPGAGGTWVASRGDGLWELRLGADEPVLDWLERVGEVPLPPYIRRPDGPTARDRERYQTVFADARGAVAAPTAGLHLTPALLAALAAAGVAAARLTLHVGPATFLPLREDDLDRVALAAERWIVPPDTAARVNATRATGGRVVAVGTTSVRALESAVDADGMLRAGAGETTLFIRPGHRFRCVDALVTNFHLPRSSLLVLVSALAGWDRVRAAYAEAVARRYRFYSYGDAMFLT